MSHTTTQHMNVFEWLQRWELILEIIAEKRSRDNHFWFDNIDFWTWVREWPEKEINILLTCLDQFSTVINDGKKKLQQGYHKYEYSLRAFVEYAANWNKSNPYKENVLKMLNSGSQIMHSTRQGATHVATISLREPYASSRTLRQDYSETIQIIEWLNRWDLLMIQIGKYVGHTGPIGVPSEFWEWVEEWQEGPMDFLITCFTRCDSVMCHGKYLLQYFGTSTVFTYSKGADLYKYAKEWKENKPTNKSYMAKFQNQSSSSSESSGLKNHPIPGKTEKYGKENKPHKPDVKRPGPSQSPDVHQRGRGDTGRGVWASQPGAAGQARFDGAGKQPRPNTSFGARNTEEDKVWHHASDKKVERPKTSVGFRTDDWHGLVDKDTEIEEGDRRAQKSSQGGRHDRLMRTKSSFERRNYETDDQVDITKEYLAAIDSKDAEISLLKSENKRLAAETHKLSTSLSKLMNQELSRDESVLENISIKNRPMKIAEEYCQIQSNQWLEAKQAIDEYTEFIWDEQQKNSFLMDVIMKSYEEAKRIFKEQRPALLELLDNPFKALQKTPLAKETRDVKLTVELEQSLSRYQKIQCQAVDLNDFSQSLLDDLTDKCKNLSKKDKKDKIKQSRRFRDFCHIFCSLSWKMVVQTPPMTFENMDTGQPFDPSKHEPHWGSQDGDDRGVVILYYICPTMYHNSQIMAKGKVLLGVPTTKYNEMHSKWY